MANFTEKVKIEVIADTKSAKDDVKDLGKDLGKITDKPAEVEVQADTTRAHHEFDDIRADLKRLQDPIKVPVTVDEDSVHSSFGRIKDTAHKAGGEGGKSFGESFVRDVGGTFAQNNPGVGMGADLAAGIETGFEALGVGSLAGPIIAALGIGTVAIAAAQTIWGILNKGADDYKKSIEAAKTVQEELFAGQNLQAIKDFDKKWGGIVQNAQDLGQLNPQDVFKFLTGQPNKPVEDFITSVQTLNGETVAAGGKLTDLNFDLGHLVESLIDTKNANKDAATQLEKTGDRQLQYLKAVGATNDELFEYAKNAAPDARRETLLYIGELNKIPPSKMTEILTDTNPDDLAQTKAEIDRIAKDREVMIHFQADIDQWLKTFITSGGNARSILGGLGINTSSSGVRAAGTSTVINNFPPTLSPVRVAGAAAKSSRRNGGLKR